MISARCVALRNEMMRISWLVPVCAMDTDRCGAWRASRSGLASAYARNGRRTYFSFAVFLSASMAASGIPRARGKSFHDFINPRLELRDGQRLLKIRQGSRILAHGLIIPNAAPLLVQRDSWTVQGPTHL